MKNAQQEKICSMTLRIDKALHGWLVSRAVDRDVSVAHIVREALKEYRDLRCPSRLIIRAKDD